MPEHAHDWPLLSLFVIGSYSNETEIGEKFICGPSAVFYRAGAAHRNTIAAVGFEQIEIEFDPPWLGRSLLPRVPVMQWIGGRAGREARQLARACEGELSAAWVGTITRRLREESTLKISDLAGEVRRHPSWVGSAHRHATGEGLQETAARFRVERATRLLRETAQPYASIALEAGFCDQSHMNRTFRRVLGRSPATVRGDQSGFRKIGT